MAGRQIMGIVNVTPDSFYDGGRFYGIEQAVQHGKLLADQGADILDIGGESTRPGSNPVSEDEELSRVIPVISELKKQVEIPLSIDTYHPKVAQAAIEYGAAIINDITGFENPLMREIAAEHDVDICVMHMLGKPKTMQNDPTYDKGVVNDLMDWFKLRIELLIASGVRPERIILDPGIGFGKTVADNLEILQNLPQFKTLGFRLLIGLSRKTFMSKILGKPHNQLLAATIAMNTWSFINGADIVRVHDVIEHKDMLTLINAL